eukprot:TRINITY_DN7727_c0_g1_i1.p1 TRINITY_DN7727_c0_g1~~TRINITY_DN7727_c0_g1_i1.p1  ORF type:complete len:665 (+),score=117.04 TRINITY_DN7727_c0_g1_i1:84-2078(+)
MATRNDVLAILDAGAQYGKLIDRKARELNVKTHLLPLNTSAEVLKNYQGIIISGGPTSVHVEEVDFDKKIWTCGVPVLGICYGMQLLAHTNEGKVETKYEREDGQYVVEVDTECPLFHGLDKNQEVLLTHGDTVVDPGKGMKVISKSGSLNAGIANIEKNLYGLQFHPEVDLSVNGKKILHNFLYRISGFSGTYTVKDRKKRAISSIQKAVGDKKVLMLVSGGVDSTVCCALLSEAIGPDRVVALHINNGFMRKNESLKVEKALTNIGIDLKVIGAEDRFYGSTTIINHGGKPYRTAKLCEVVNPEEKRKIIGDTFMHVAQDVIAELGFGDTEMLLAQGTLRPDLIESASTLASHTAQVIKTHHNDTELVRKLRTLGGVIEPLQSYHKDEVRILGRDLGLPDEIVWRQPFPGPGLSIRILCAREPFIDESFHRTNRIISYIVSKAMKTEEKIPDIDEKDKYLIDEFLKNLRDNEKHILKNYSDKIAATILPISTVGVQGDSRTYSYACALTCNGDPDWSILFILARLITRICHSVNRVVYIFGDLIPGPITQVTPTLLTSDVINLLQEVDEVVNQVLFRYDLVKRLSQVPVILIPITFSEIGLRSVVIRTFITEDFMTGRPAVPGKDVDISALNDILEGLKSFKEISRVAYDLTFKPPGTTEWE